MFAELPAYGLLIGWIRCHQRTLMRVVLFAFIGTTASLIQPLVYRAVVNDLSGLYVYSATQQAQGATTATIDTSHAHRRGHVEPRTVDQAARTLFMAVGLLFLINLGSRFFALSSDNLAAQPGARIEHGVMVRALRHVLKLPLRFFTGRSGRHW